MVKLALSSNGMGNVSGGGLSALADNNAVYVSNGQGNAVLIPIADYKRYRQAGYLDSQIVARFFGQGRPYNNWAAFRATLNPNIDYRIHDENGNHLA